MGVELYSIDSLGSEPLLINRIDTEGNAEKVVLTEDGLFVACDDAGAYYIPKISFLNEKNVHKRFAKDLTVDHISVKDNIAVLSLGSKGIALMVLVIPWRQVSVEYFLLDMSIKLSFGVIIYWSAPERVCKF